MNTTWQWEIICSLHVSLFSSIKNHKASGQQISKCPCRQFGNGPCDHKELSHKILRFCYLKRPRNREVRSEIKYGKPTFLSLHLLIRQGFLPLICGRSATSMGQISLINIPSIFLKNQTQKSLNDHRTLPQTEKAHRCTRYSGTEVGLLKLWLSPTSYVTFSRLLISANLPLRLSGREVKG